MPNAPGIALFALIAATLLTIAWFLSRRARRREPARMWPAGRPKAMLRVALFLGAAKDRPNAGDDEIAATLVAEGVPSLDAELIVRLVPVAFAWAKLRRLGQREFPIRYVAFDRRQRPVEFPLARERYFAAGLEYGDEITGDDFPFEAAKKDFERIASGSAYRDAIEAFGENPTRALTLKPPILLGIDAEAIRARDAK